MSTPYLSSHDTTTPEWKFKETDWVCLGCTSGDSSNVATVVAEAMKKWKNDMFKATGYRNEWMEKGLGEIVEEKCEAGWELLELCTGIKLEKQELKESGSV